MISKLPVELQSAFRTGITITSLPQCVIELVLNSLDANASRIGVRIDLDKYNLQVVDNGCGIDRAQLELVGERYMTSKCSSLADLEGNAKHYGYRGEAIASIKDACEAMVVISKPEGHSSTFSKVMKGGSEINSRVSKAMLNRPGNGTTVAVTNLFYNLPVRRRRMYGAIELEQLRHQMQAIALIHPKVSFTLRDDVTKSVVFNTKQCSDIIENFNQISKLEFSTDSFVEVTHTTHPTFKINGFVCKKTYKSKEHQHIYVNNRLIENRKLYAFFNHKLSKSFYFHATKMKSIGSGFSKNFDFDTFKKSPETSTGGDYAIFIINIMCPYKEYDITLDPKKHLVEFKDWDEALACLAKSADIFVKHDKSLDSALMSLHPGDNQENVGNEFSTTGCNLSIKKSGKMSPVAEKSGDTHLEVGEKQNVGVDMKNKEKLKSMSAKTIEATVNDESSLIAGVKNKISSPLKKICKRIENDNPDNKPSSCKNAHKRPSIPKTRKEIPNVNENIDDMPPMDKKRHKSPNRRIKKRESPAAGRFTDDVMNTPNKNNENIDDTPPKGSDKKRHKSRNRRIEKRESPAAGRITDDVMNTPNKNIDMVPNGVTMDTNRRDNDFKTKTCTGNIHKENSPSSLLKLGGEMSCTKRPLSQGHSEHVLTQCNYDFSSKLRKRMRLGCVETNNYRTILPFVHAETYETNLKRLKYSMSRLCGGQITENVLGHRKIKKSRTKAVMIDSRMEDNQPKDTKTSHSTSRKLNEGRPKKVVTFFDEACRVDCHSEDPSIANVPEDLYLNSIFKSRIHEKKADIEFQIDNHQLLKNLDNNFSPLIRRVNNESKGNHFPKARFEANRRISDDYESIIRGDTEFLSPKIGLNDSHAVMENSFKGNTIEDLFFSKTAFKRHCDPIECNFQQLPLFNSFQQKDKSDSRIPENYRIKPSIHEFKENACKTVDRSFNFENSMENVRNCPDNVNASGIGVQNSTFVLESSPYTSEFINSYTSGLVSNNVHPEFYPAHYSCKSGKKDFSDERINPETLETTHDVPPKNDFITNKAQINDGNTNKDHTISDGKNCENCACKVNEIISFYKLKHHCCSVQVTDKVDEISGTDESKKWSVSKVDEVKHVSTNSSQLNLNQECLKQGHLGSPNDENKNSDQIIVADNMRNMNVRDKLFVSENSDKTDSQTGYENQNQEQYFMDSSYENDESDYSSVTQYNMDHPISTRNEDLKISSIHSNENLANEDRKFSFYFQPRISNTWKMFDGCSQETSDDSLTFQKENNIQTQLSRSLDNFRREFIDEFSPIVDNNCDILRENKYSYDENQKTSSVPKIEKCLESVGTFEKKDFIGPQIRNVPNRSNFFQFDDFDTKRSVTPLILEKSLYSNEKNHIKECNNPYEEKSVIPLSFGNNGSQKTFENCATPYKKRSRKLDTPLKLANRTTVGNRILKDDDVCSKSGLENSIDDCLPPQTNSIFHEGSEIDTKIITINDEKANFDETELNMKLSEFSKNSGSVKLEGSKKLSSPQTLSIFHDSLESNHGIRPKMNHASPSHTISIFHDSSEISNKVSSIVDMKENSEVEVNSNTNLCNIDEIPNKGESEMSGERPSSPQTVSIFHGSSETNNEIKISNSSTTGVEKIEDESDLRKNPFETVNLSSPSVKNDVTSFIFDVDVKYLVSKEKVNSRAAVSEDKTKYNGSVPSKSDSDAIDYSAENSCPESKRIGEDNNYFANATGFTLEYNTDVVNGDIFENEKAVTDEKKEPKEDFKTSVNNSLNSNFLDNLAGAYNFQLTPCSKSKAENVLGFFHSPKGKEIEWVEQILPSGLRIFIHKSTGMSSYVDPYVEHPKAFNTSARNPLLPRGMSPILINPDNCTNVGLPDLTCDQKQNILDVAKEQKISTLKEMEDNSNEKGKLVHTSMIQLLKNDMNQEKIGIIQLPFQIASNTNSNCMFSIKHLEDAEVIGLLDNRFIVTMINVSSTETKKNVITLFDQHAVDERIRFESLLDGYKNEDGGFLSSDLISPIVVTVDHNHMKIIKEFIAKFEFIGLKFNILDDTLTVTGVPKCLLKRAEKESSCQCKEFLEQGIKNLLHEQIETLLKTGGVVLSRPVTLTSIIAYEACRGAIKFGDSISLTTAQFLLKKLSQCRAPFQCAHGRPVLAPIIELPPY